MIGVFGLVGVGAPPRSQMGIVEVGAPPRTLFWELTASLLSKAKLNGLLASRARARSRSALTIARCSCYN